jgi:hypothetical protein
MRLLFDKMAKCIRTHPEISHLGKLANETRNADAAARWSD